MASYIVVVMLIDNYLLLLLMLMLCQETCSFSVGFSGGGQPLSLQPQPKQEPENSILFTMSLAGGKAICREIIPPSLPLDHKEDEVEMWYPTQRKTFVFSTNDDVDNKDYSTIPVEQEKQQIKTTLTIPTPLTIRETSFGCGKLGFQVWDSSIALSLYLIDHCQKEKGGDSKDFKLDTSYSNMKILELGAGCGLPSLVSNHVLNAEKVLTTDFWEHEGDQPQKDEDSALDHSNKPAKQSEKTPERLIPDKFHGINLQYNMEHGGGDSALNRRPLSNINIQRLDWHDPTTISKAISFDADLIIGSDLIYYPMDVQPLINTLKSLLTQTLTLTTRNSTEGDSQTNRTATIANKARPHQEQILPSQSITLPTRTPQILLMFPLPPNHREALPFFRKQIVQDIDEMNKIINTRTRIDDDDKPTGFCVEMNDTILQYRERGEISKFVAIKIYYRHHE